MEWFGCWLPRLVRFILVNDTSSSMIFGGRSSSMQFLAPNQICYCAEGRFSWFLTYLRLAVQMVDVSHCVRTRSDSSGSCRCRPFLLWYSKWVMQRWWSICRMSHTSLVLFLVADSTCFQSKPLNGVTLLDSGGHRLTVNVIGGHGLRSSGSCWWSLDWCVSCVKRVPVVLGPKSVIN